MNSNFILKVLQLMAMFPNDMCDQLMWRCDGQYAPVTFFVNCNDVFYWGCADLETITPENVAVLEQSITDCKAASHVYWADALFCCRVRRMRPQGAYYKHLPESLIPLFDAAGPERDPKEPGNTRRP